MKYCSAVVAGSAAVAAASAVWAAVSAASVANSAALKITTDLQHAARDIHLRLVEKGIDDPDLRETVFPGHSGAHLYLNGWVMYHDMMVRTGVESWSRLEDNLTRLFATEAGQDYCQQALERFQHPKHDEHSQRFAQVLQEAAAAGASGRRQDRHSAQPGARVAESVVSQKPSVNTETFLST
ncbi:hypothetical protein GCM10022223_37880 [Kineosporia mesophila]|uniref:Uncharacterized protein n=1 Tax=Kineosporia mesophila TaxID=566012 RepID=A0ABP6ZV92_9ACTN|nr:DUF6082 family protein [Kineosporia mesophila]MCD5349789.1 DUF6082 family protein [Kineosporia mesophila]